MTSVRILSDIVLQREKKRAWARSCREGGRAADLRAAVLWEFGVVRCLCQLDGEPTCLRDRKAVC